MKTSRRSINVLFSLACVICAGRALALTDPVLDNNSATMTANLMPSASAGQGVLPLHIQRGVGIDGSMRAGSTLGWALAGNPSGEGWNGNGTFAGVTLATGAPSVSAVDMALPSAGPRWVVGRSYNDVQTTNGTPAGTHTDSNGFQGRNWFQSSQPEISVYVDAGNHANDVVYIVYGADRFLEFARTGSSSTEYKGKNGTAGVVQYSAGSPDVWTYTDQLGNVTSFFGGNTGSGDGDWQFWKMADEAGNTIYVGDKTTASTAVTNGYSGKRIQKAYDQADRRYTYGYTTLDSVVRLTQVKAETKSSGTWSSPSGLATVGQVDYDYYSSADSGEETSGTGNADFKGCLKMATVTTTLSDGSTTLATKTYYRYYPATYNSSTNPGSVYQLALILGAEGCRKYDWDQDSTLDDDFRTETTANLKPYCDAYFTHYDVLSGTTSERARIKTVFFNGQCGCSGGANGLYTFTYGTNGSYSDNSGYDTAWCRRVVVAEPTGRWTTQYIDEVGAPLSRVISDQDPASASNFWTTQAVRNSDGQLTEIHSPANITGYTHSTASFTASSSVGLVTLFERVAGGSNTSGLLSADSWQKGTSGQASYVSQLTYSTASKTIGGSNVVRPFVTSTVRYEDEHDPNPLVDQALAVTFGGTVTVAGGTLSDQDRVTTSPTPVAGKNGSGSASVSAQAFNADRTLAFTKSADPTPIIGYRAYDAATGLVTKSIQDADTSLTSMGQDFYGVTVPSSPTNYAKSGTALHLKTTYTYDVQGRLSTATAPDGVVSQQYVSRLSDGRIVSLSVPRVVAGMSTTYYSPVSYTVSNQAGQVEFQATVAFSSGSTTTGISSWIDTTKSDPILALTTGTITRMSTRLYSVDGHRVTESRAYFVVPGSGAGSAGTNYDATTYGYDDAGRQWRVKQPTGTITRSVFDAIGRPSENWIGTNDYSFSGGEVSGPDNMTKTSIRVYDSGSAGGNSLVTSATQDPDGDWDNTGTGGHPADDRRTTTYTYDVRGRVLLTVGPATPYTYVKYDNLGRILASAGYSSTASITPGTTDPAGSATNDKANRLSLSETFYDDVGRVYMTKVHKINTSTGASDDNIPTYTWYDSASRVIKTQGTSISKTKYDRLGRATNQYAIGYTDDRAVLTANGYTDAQDVAGDMVMEERQTIYDNTTGLVFFTVNLQRDHDDTSSTGALDGNHDGDLSTLTASTTAAPNNDVNPTKVRASINATWYDAMRRPTGTCAYGTNYDGVNNKNLCTFTRPGSVPSRSDIELVTTTVYDDDGSVLSTTDPRGLETRTFYDAMGRPTKTQRNYVNGTPGGGTNGDEDQTIEYGYTNGLMTSYLARVPGGSDQTTTYIFGSTKGTSAGQSAIASGHLLRATKFPDSSNMGTTLANIDSDSSDTVSQAYNTLGQEIYRKDQAGNVTQTDYDTAGRTIYRRVTTLISGFDNAVLRIGTAYDSRSRVTTVTQYDNATVGSGSVVDEVKYVYDDWGNLTNFQQDRDSAVSSSGGTNGYQEVAYTYDSTAHQATGGAMGVRRTGATLPGSFAVTYDYDSSNSLNDCLNRVYQVKFGGTSIAKYKYLGMGMVVDTEMPEPAVASRLHDAASPAVYDRLDRFNRVTSSRWRKTVSGGRDFYRVDLEYDRDSNITTATDTVQPGYDAKYTMDGLNRLIVADEGTLSAGSITSRTRKEGWTLNQVGGWTGHTNDLDGSGSYTSTGFGPTQEINETRTFNTANEIATRVDNSVTKTPVYNDNGQQTDDGVNYTSTWDAFGRLTKVSTRGGSPATVVEYKYNGLNMQIGRHADMNASGTVTTSDLWEWTIYDPQWRRVATYMVAGTAFTASADTDPKERYVHHNAGRGGSGGSSYIDSIILRDRDDTNGLNGAADGVLEHRLYYCQNWRADVSVTMVDTGRILEWIKYSAYGVAQRTSAAEYNHDGAVDFFDDNDFATDYGMGSPPTSADINFDGVVDSSDNTMWALTYADGYDTSRGDLAQTTTNARYNRLGYAGYWIESATQQYLVRNRELDPLVGTWDERDPIENGEGPNLYSYVLDRPISRKDPSGLRSIITTPTLPGWDVPAPAPSEVQDDPNWDLWESGCSGLWNRCNGDPWVEAAKRLVRSNCTTSSVCKKWKFKCVPSSDQSTPLTYGYAKTCCSTCTTFMRNDDHFTCGTLAHELVQQAGVCTTPCVATANGCGNAEDPRHLTQRGCERFLCTAMQAIAYGCCQEGGDVESCITKEVDGYVRNTGCGQFLRADTVQALRRCCLPTNLDCSGGFRDLGLANPRCPAGMIPPVHPLDHGPYSSAIGGCGGCR